MEKPKHVAQWRMMLTDYAAPLRPHAGDAITIEHILQVLRPICHAKPENRVSRAPADKGWPEAAIGMPS
jgi:hypothetical protein